MPDLPLWQHPLRHGADLVLYSATKFIGAHSDLIAGACLGSLIAFSVDGGEERAFRFLNALRLIKLAVSLGGTESLAEHPSTMTHADVPPPQQERMGIGLGLVRLSVGVEHFEDILADVRQALEAV